MAYPRSVIQGRCALVLATMLFALPRAALAQSPNDQMLAQSLFDEARTLMDRGRFAEACPKLAESQRLDPGGGTMLNLALCYERQGKLATAYTQMSAALAQATRDGRKDREAIAREHLGALQPRIPKIAIHVAHEEEGIEVKLDGSIVRRPAWDVASGVDPGTHVVEAELPGKPRYRTEIVLAEQEEKIVEVPSFTPAPRPSTRTTASLPEEPAPRGPLRPNPAYYAALGLGATGMLVGIVSGIAWAASGSADSALGNARDVLGVTALVGLSVGVAGFVTCLAVPSSVRASFSPQPGGGFLTATLSLP